VAVAASEEDAVTQVEDNKNDREIKFLCHFYYVLLDQIYFAGRFDNSVGAGDGVSV